MKRLDTMGFVMGAWIVAGCSGGGAILPGGEPAPDGGSHDSAGATDVGAPFADGGMPTMDGGPWSPLCPAEVPASGTPCPTNDLTCEYGDSAEPVCNTIAQCLSSPLAWTLETPDPKCPYPAPTNSPGCPASYAEVAAGAACSSGGGPGFGECWYPDGQCDCNLDLTLHSRTWSCVPQPAACPASPPRIGAPCGAAGIACNYFSCQLAGIQVECQDGVWFGGPGGCAQANAGGSP
jgi:hypothetical protein